MTDAVPYWVDGWLLACLTDWRWRWSRPMPLREVINRMDVIFGGRPTFDDLSFSLSRVIAAGLVIADRDRHGNLRLKATDAAFDLKARHRDKSPSGGYMIKAVGASPMTADIPEDRSLGRYAELSPDEWRATETGGIPSDIRRR